MDFIDNNYFLGTLSIGILIVYLILPEHNIIFKQDSVNTMIDVKEVTCDK